MENAHTPFPRVSFEKFKEMWELKEVLRFETVLR